MTAASRPVPVRDFPGRWGPVLGAAVFHVTQEVSWTYFLGWQRVALGLLIVVIVVIFPLGILGWARERWPHRFGHKVET